MDTHEFDYKIFPRKRSRFRTTANGEMVRGGFYYVLNGFGSNDDRVRTLKTVADLGQYFDERNKERRQQERTASDPRSKQSSKGTITSRTH